MRRLDGRLQKLPERRNSTRRPAHESEAVIGLARKKSPPRPSRAGQTSAETILRDDRVNPLAILALDGPDLQVHLFSQGPAEEAAHAVSLPGGRLHELRQSRAFGPLDQSQDRRLFTAPRERFFSPYGFWALCGGGLAFLAVVPLPVATHARGVRERGPSWRVSVGDRRP